MMQEKLLPIVEHGASTNGNIALVMDEASLHIGIYNDNATTATPHATPATTTANWDLYWTDLSVSEARVSKMKPFQRINHFPGMMEICRKAALSRNLKRMQTRCPAQYSFAPTTWDYPKELDAFRRYSRANPGWGWGRCKLNSRFG